MSDVIAIASRPIGAGHPAYLVAEMSGNHNGDLQRAIDTVHAAAGAGADAIKLQTYTADTMTIDERSGPFVVSGDGPWSGRSLYDLYREAHTPWKWHEALIEAATAAGMQVFSTVFDVSAVDFVEALGVPAFKIASFELVDDGLLQRVGRTGKPVLLSTGMASLQEIAHAVDTLRATGATEMLLLRCTSAYPAPDSGMHLGAIPVLARTFGCPVGLSDHSLGTVAPVVAVTLGASLVEKHFTLSRKDGGVDGHFSLEPAEFRRVVEDVRRAERMGGEPRLGPDPVEADMAALRRSLYVIADMEPGEAFSVENVRSIRPGLGLAPRHLKTILGLRVCRPVRRGTPVSWDLLSAD